MKDEIFKAMATTYPQVEPLRQMRQTLSKMKLTSLTVGPDARGRASSALSAQSQGAVRQAVLNSSLDCLAGTAA